MDTVKIKVQRFDPAMDRKPFLQEFDVPWEEDGTVLQALMYISEELDPSLSFRYDCRYYRCGLCGVEVNGRPRLACRAKLKDGLVLRPLRHLPLVRDLVVDRSLFYGTLERLSLYVDAEAEETLRVIKEPPEHVQVERCVECFCCLATCPTYDSQDEAVGGPFHFVKLAQMHFHPLDEHDRVAQAAALGVDRCAACRKCHCAIGIPIFKVAIAPLMNRVTSTTP